MTKAIIILLVICAVLAALLIALFLYSRKILKYLDTATKALTLAKKQLDQIAISMSDKIENKLNFSIKALEDLLLESKVRYNKNSTNVEEKLLDNGFKKVE